jgi:hypothetical protein
MIKPIVRSIIKGVVGSSVGNKSGVSWSSYWSTRFSVTKAGAGETITISLKGIIGASQIEVEWGDGNSDLLTMNGALNAVSNTYTSAGTYYIVITNLASLDSISMTNANCAGNVIDITAFNKATNLKNFRADYGTVAGSINGISHTMEEFQLTASSGMAVSGDWTAFNNLKRLNLVDQTNTCTGTLNATNNPNLYRVYLNGTGAMSLQVEGLPLTYIEGNGSNKSINGSIAGILTLQEICSSMGGLLTGDISGLFATFRYLDIYQNGLTGDISGLTLMTRFRETVGGSDFSGDISAWSVISNFGLVSGSVTKLTRLTGTPILSYLKTPDNWQYSAAEMNQLMADLWANKDNAFSATYSERLFDFTQNALSKAPTGQGLTDKTALEAYRSPNPPGTAALWTINTVGLGVELVNNGTFISETGWTYTGVHMSISGGKMNAVNAESETAWQYVSLASGHNYRLKLKIDSGGTIYMAMVNANWATVARQAAGTFYIDFTATTDGFTDVYIQTYGITTSFVLSEVSIKEIL